MTSELLIAHRAASARIAVRDGESISAGRFVAAAEALAQQLPPAQYVLNSCRDRYLFAVGFCAAMIAGRTSLLPPSRTPETLAQLAMRYPDTLYLVDDAGQMAWHTATTAATKWRVDQGAQSWPPPALARDHVAAIAFTSGSTGEPQAQLKTWGGIVDGARAETIALHLDDAPLAMSPGERETLSVPSGGLGASTLNDVVLVGTVSAQHMYGFESTVLMALHGPCAFAAEHPLHPDEVVAVLSRISGRRVLITAPVHLRALAESAHSMPALDRVVSATAPLTLELAQRCESMWSTRVFEVYGCTETGMVATRRTVDGPVWTTMRDVKVEDRDGEFHAHGGHVQPGRLADRLRLISDSTFELEGRTDDVVNIGGKRASLRRAQSSAAVDRRRDRRRDIRAARRTQCHARAAPDGAGRGARHHARRAARRAARTDRSAFLPRPLLRVDALPRNAQGKLPRAELLALAEEGAAVRPGVNRSPKRRCRRRVTLDLISGVE